MTHPLHFRVLLGGGSFKGNPDLFVRGDYGRQRKHDPSGELSSRVPWKMAGDTSAAIFEPQHSQSLLWVILFSAWAALFTLERLPAQALFMSYSAHTSSLHAALLEFSAYMF